MLLPYYYNKYLIIVDGFGVIGASRTIESLPFNSLFFDSLCLHVCCINNIIVTDTNKTIS